MITIIGLIFALVATQLLKHRLCRSQTTNSCAMRALLPRLRYNRTRSRDAQTFVAELTGSPAEQAMAS